MQIKKIQHNNSCNMNFSANLKITGAIEDISLKQFKLWENKAKLIGSEADIIEFEFGKSIDIDVFKKLPKPTNPKFIGNWKRLVWRFFRVYPFNSDTLFISKRNIKASITLKDNYSENIGYFCDYCTKAEDKDIKKWHKEATKECVNEYFRKLKSDIKR